MGIPVVIAENGIGVPIKSVDEGDLNYNRVPVMTVAENGFGLPIVLSDLGAPARVEGGGVPGWVPADIRAANPVFALDMINGRSYPGNLETSFTRASSAWQIDSDDDTFLSFASGEERISGFGLLTEFAADNAATDPDMAGVIVGTVPSAVPNWSVVTDAGLTTEVLSKGTWNGAPYARIRIHGTTTGADYQLRFGAVNSVPAVSGETWVASMAARLVAGSLTNTTGRNIRCVEAAGSTFVSATSTALDLAAPNLKTARKSAVRTFNGGTTTRAEARFQATFSGAGVAIDMTLDFVFPNLVKQPVQIAPILATSRAADNYTIAVPAGMKSIVVGPFRVRGYKAGETVATLFQLDDGTANERARVVYEISTGKLLAQVYSGGVQQCSLDLGTVTLEAEHTVAFAWEINNFAASLSGAAAVTDASGTAPVGLTTFRAGAGLTLAEPAAATLGAVYGFTTFVPPEDVS